MKDINASQQPKICQGSSVNDISASQQPKVCVWFAFDWSGPITLIIFVLVNIRRETPLKTPFYIIYKNKPEFFSQISCDLAQELIMFPIMGKDSQT